MLGASRLFILIVAAIMIGGGGALILAGPQTVVPGVVVGTVGIGGIVVVLLERVRYSSDTAEHTDQPVSRAGGDPAGTRLPPGFQPTDERFRDPSTGVLMRVWFDPSTGERRYLPDRGGGGGR